jgi:integrase
MTPIYPSEIRRRQKLKKARRRQRKPKRPKGERYDTRSYRRAIEYGLRMAKKYGFAIPHWHPHQLRHNRGTEVRRKYGIEAAQVALGHVRADVIEIYAERNFDLARRVAMEMG